MTDTTTQPTFYFEEKERKIIKEAVDDIYDKGFLPLLKQYQQLKAGAQQNKPLRGEDFSVAEEGFNKVIDTDLVPVMPMLGKRLIKANAKGNVN